MTFIQTWDETLPSDTKQASLGASDIRALTQAIRERLAIDHYNLAAEGGDAKIGYHKKTTLIDQVNDLLGAAGAVVVYGKSVSGVVELFLVLADNTVIQLTTGGKLNGASFANLNNIPAAAGVIPAANLPAYPGAAAGTWKNLKVAYASASTVTVTADWVILSDGSRVNNVNFTCNIAASGLNGLDTGAEANSTWYRIYVVDATHGILSVSSSSPTGQAVYAKVSAVRNNSSGNFVPFTHTGRRYCYTSWMAMASGDTVNGNWVTVDTSGFVPSDLSTYAFGSLSALTNGACTNDSSVTNPWTYPGIRNQYNYAISSGGIAMRWEFDIITADTLYWSATSSASNTFYIHGFEINKL